MALPLPSVLYIDMVAIKVLPEAVGAQARRDFPSSKPAVTYFSWIGVRVGNLLYCFLKDSGKGKLFISICILWKMNVYNCLGLKCIILLLKTTHLPELSSRTMFYHLQMMTVQMSKISSFKWLLRNSCFFTPLFLRKTYKHFFGVKGVISNYLKRSISQIERCFGTL